MKTPSPPHLLLRLAPPLTLALLVLPVAAGLSGALLPAMGWLPALGAVQPSLQPWRSLMDAPGLGTSVMLALATGWAATLTSLALATAATASLHGQTGRRRMGAWLAPLLALPHSSLAIGLAFVILPSGWLVRAVSPWLTGWALPPDIGTVGHPSGWPVVLALVLKETPYLALMMLGALNQFPATHHLRAARALGYAPAQAWLAVVLPQVLVQIRLPVMAVLAFSLSVVDVAMILGPGHPPTLAVTLVRWASDPDPQMLFPAAAGSVLLLALVLASLALWRVIDSLLLAALAGWARRGSRQPAFQRAAAVGTGIGLALLVLAVAAVLSLCLWSLAAHWRWPSAWPGAFTIESWRRQSASLLGPAVTSLALALLATAGALVLALACVENEAQSRRRSLPGLGLLYLPLLLPQVGFLFGLQVLLVRWNLDGRFAAVLWAHLVFVLPYVLLSLTDVWRHWDERYTRTALSLGASRWRTFWRIKLPMLLPPVLSCAAVGFAVSAGLYLPTLLAGAGCVVTLTTEAVTLSAGADRRVIGVWALLQAALPLAVYTAALAWSHRRGRRP